MIMTSIKTGVIGFPISHSVSPYIHGYWLKKYNIEGDYNRFEIAPENLESFLLSMHQNQVFGINITVPHKEAAWDILAKSGRLNKCNDLKCKVAKLLRATNTVTALPNGNFLAANTDFIGFANNLILNAPDFNFESANALVLGAGGAAKAIVFALISILKVKSITITNRSIEKCEEIVKLCQTEFNYTNISIVEWDNRSAAVANNNLIINTTSLGMKGKDKLEIDLIGLQKNSLVTDIVYNPLQTDILKQAQNQGAQTIDGLGMLMHQAAPAFEGWYGKKPEVTAELRNILIEKLGL
jgi:shikimate dehydrogenase